MAGLAQAGLAQAGQGGKSFVEAAEGMIAGGHNRAPGNEEGSKESTEDQ